jgi:hypothetical protein
MQHIPELDGRKLREFGVLTGGLTVGLFGVLLPWFGNFPYPAWPWWLGGALAVWALAAPRKLRLVYRAWMRIGHAMGRITTPLILGAVFFLVITPMAFVMRVARRDPLARKFDATVSTYRIISAKPSKEDMEKPF